MLGTDVPQRRLNSQVRHMTEHILYRLSRLPLGLREKIVKEYRRKKSQHFSNEDIEAVKVDKLITSFGPKYYNFVRRNKQSKEVTPTKPTKLSTHEPIQAQQAINQSMVCSPKTNCDQFSQTALPILISQSSQVSSTNMTSQSTQTSYSKGISLSTQTDVIPTEIKTTQNKSTQTKRIILCVETQTFEYIPPIVDHALSSSSSIEDSFSTLNTIKGNENLEQGIVNDKVDSPQIPNSNNIPIIDSEVDTKLSIENSHLGKRHVKFINKAVAESLLTNNSILRTCFDEACQEYQSAEINSQYLEYLQRAFFIDPYGFLDCAKYAQNLNGFLSEEGKQIFEQHIDYARAIDALLKGRKPITYREILQIYDHHHCTDLIYISPTNDNVEDQENLVKCDTKSSETEANANITSKSSESNLSLGKKYQDYLKSPEEVFLCVHGYGFFHGGPPFTVSDGRTVNDGRT
ncbi:unnamed protein product [Rotaria magnacalcarata]|uniref:Uncharacterized protein n=1 Tax=Rotaria magnacalcarata TaxID=392030 RepID=A0A820E916_9BILA|nr:unnamed protein product [Rotaria magnacalcarata]